MTQPNMNRGDLQFDTFPTESDGHLVNLRVGEDIQHCFTIGDVYSISRGGNTVIIKMNDEDKLVISVPSAQMAIHLFEMVQGLLQRHLQPKEWGAAVSSDEVEDA